MRQRILIPVGTFDQRGITITECPHESGRLGDLSQKVRESSKKCLVLLFSSALLTKGYYLLEIPVKNLRGMHFGDMFFGEERQPTFHFI